MIKYNSDNEVLEALKKEFSRDSEKVLSIGYGKGKKDLVYLSVESVRARLDDVLGLNWNWETIETVYSQFIKAPSKQKLDDGSYGVPAGAGPVSIPTVSVTGRLTLHLPSGIAVFRDGNGGSSLDKGTGPGDPEKIAASDAFKRAAWFFGIGAYLRNGTASIDNTSVMDSSRQGFIPQVPNQQQQNWNRNTTVGGVVPHNNTFTGPTNHQQEPIIHQTGGLKPGRP
jgi:hypothetical protein